MKGDPKFGFGSEKRGGPNDGKSALNPGPGNYNIDSGAFDSRNPRFHMGQKLPPIKGATETPGVGSYSPSPERVMGSGPSFSIKQRLGDLSNKNASPGPGSYDYNLRNKNQGAQYGFGTS